jgi:chromate reductase
LNTPLRILGIPGSLRRGSYNKAALATAQQLAPTGTEIEIFDLEGLPLYNQDNERQPPVRVVEFKTRIRAADAILFSTPEYNYSIPGVLKNSIDWASRPSGDNAWQGKPVALMGVTGGLLGTARAQYHLRQIFVTLDMYALNKPEVMIGSAKERFDEAGNLTDEKTRASIKKLMEALVVWTQHLARGKA